MFNEFISIDKIKDNNFSTELENNIDYLSANLFCLFFRFINNSNYDVEQIFSSYQLKIHVESNKEYSKYNINYKLKNNQEKDDWLNEHLEYKIKDIQQTLQTYIYFLSNVTKKYYKKIFEIDLVDYFELYHNYNNKYHFNKKVPDSLINKTFIDSCDIVMDFQDSFRMKLYLTLINKYGDDLFIDFKTKKILSSKSKENIQHKKSTSIREDFIYTLCDNLFFYYKSHNICSLNTILNYSKKDYDNPFLLNDLNKFISDVEKLNLNEIFITIDNKNIKKNRL